MKCKFWKVCKIYDKRGVVCNKDNGCFMASGKYASCYRELEAKKKKMKQKTLITIILIAIILLYLAISIYFAWTDGYFIEPPIHNPCVVSISNLNITIP